METIHKSVLFKEVLDYVLPAVGVDEVGLIVDATVGEGGHSRGFLEKYPNAYLVGIDADVEILERAEVRLQEFDSRVKLINGWYDEILKGMIPERRGGVDIVFFDLGVSMFHFLNSGRGFSFSRKERLDMRLNLASSLTAYDVVNRYSREELTRVIREYGEERFAYRIAERIVRERERGKIESAKELEEIVWRAVPKNYRYRKINPSTKTFQAIRIEVNNELERLQRALDYSSVLLKTGGVIGVISFHSLEDRIVKKYFKKLKGDFLSGMEKPIPLDGGVLDKEGVEKFVFETLTNKPVTPGKEELKSNSAARSAKLRVYRKV